MVKSSMMKLKIIKDSNPIMRKRSLPVELPLSKEDRELLDAMRDYLIKSQDDEYAKRHNLRAGVGLAAIQTGALKRMFVVHIPEEDKIFDYQLVNPKIVESSVKKCALEGGEGCLSVDDTHEGLVHRYHKIVIKAFDALSNQDVTLKLSGYEAVVVQHEYDHLNGLFYYDHIDKNNPTLPLPNEEII